MAAVQCLAARAVGETLRGHNLDRVLEAALRKDAVFGAGERAAVHAITFSTLRHLGLLQAQLARLLTRPLTDAAVRHLLLVALAQLQFSRTAAHVIVDQAVLAAERLGLARAKGLVNAVLRNYLRQPADFERARFEDPVARFDFPRWWIDRVRLEFPDDAAAILESSHAPPPMWLRVNARRTTPSAYLEMLAQAGIGVDAHAGHAVRLAQGLPVDRLPGFADGLVSVQDLGAQWAAALLAPQSGQRVLDACAAPGGKAGHLLETVDCDLLALDDDAERLQRVEGNLQRLGLAAAARVADATKRDIWWDRQPFDRILVDAPCSGSGVVRRHPDIKWTRRIADLAAFAAQQQAMLGALWPALKPGGRLLYATCSIFLEENDAVVERHLARHDDAVRLPMDALCAQGAAIGDNPAHLAAGRLMPNDAHDGFFYALLEKRG
ncbi:MAG: 16S rRNA (cytosine(967)-C(5))-methyltransferase RsmB [Betaproteobacteria bacterium]|nr:16S rRNA (cytosine(967)-C(5))-methyltransferase RsmB [Betaproteobacteria bacterium]